ncbi:hypothetical protein ABZ891_37740 [Streptomyces sp. NPDC047023]|uniref:hypothetical protein n=1 Tax=Streptomyces sp. NPDC047023 TaxID=3155139 RepID=UPI0033F2842D
MAFALVADMARGDHTSDLAERHTAHLLASAALATLPNNLDRHTPALTDGRDANHDTLRRAIAFIENSADRSITLSAIAAAAHVTPRALQYALMTPPSVRSPPAGASPVRDGSLSPIAYRLPPTATAMD